MSNRHSLPLPAAFLSALLISLIMSGFAPAALGQNDPSSLYKKANTYYQKQDYDNAIKTYEQLIAEGREASEVYFNLGNSYYKTGNTAKSILNYERAKRLAPDDEDIAFNLRVASLKAVDKIEPVPDIFYIRWLRAIATAGSVSLWNTILILCIWLLFSSAAFFALSKSSFRKKAAFVFMLAFLFLGIVSGLIARQSNSIMYHEKYGIISSASVYIKSSPDEKGNDLFILHEGTKVQVLDELGEWQKVRIVNGSLGWMKKADLYAI
jgi:tetratricopeptide (TPR) repeat protein